MRLFVMTAMLLVSFTASASEITGTVNCALYDEANHSAAASTQITVEANGTGGVAQAVAELGEIKCSASGFSKFGMQSLTNIAVTVNGIKIESPVSNGKKDGLLRVGDGSCVCFVK